MKIAELLFEYDLKKIQQLDGLLAQRQPDRSRPKAASVKELADWLENQMNIRSGEVIYWILSRYLKPLPHNQYGINRWEDIDSRLIPALEKYTKLKNKKKIPPEKRDINQIKSLGELADLLDQFPDEEVASKKEQSSAEEQGYYTRKEATLLYNDSQIKVVIPHTEDASCYFGKATKWCTAAKTRNMFKHYNKRGPLYIVLIKPLNQRYQFHWDQDEEQFMDEADYPINPNELADKYPVLWEIFSPIAEKNSSIALNQDPSEQSQISGVTRNPRAITYIKNPSEQVQLAAVRRDPRAIGYIKNPSEKVQFALLKGYPEGIRYIEDPSEQLQLAAVTQQGTAIGFINNPTGMFTIKNPSEQVQLAAVRQDPRAIRYIKDPSEEVQLAAVKKNEYAINYIKNPTPRVRALAKQLGVR